MRTMTKTKRMRMKMRMRMTNLNTMMTMKTLKMTAAKTTLTKPAAMMVRMKAAEDMDAKGSRRAAKADQVPVSSEMTAS